MLPNQEVVISESILLTSDLNIVLVRQLRENMDRRCRSVPHGPEDFQPSTECKWKWPLAYKVVPAGFTTQTLPKFKSDQKVKGNRSLCALPNCSDVLCVYVGGSCNSNSDEDACPSSSWFSKFRAQGDAACETGRATGPQITLNGCCCVWIEISLGAVDTRRWVAVSLLMSRLTPCMAASAVNVGMYMLSADEKNKIWNAFTKHGERICTFTCSVPSNSSAVVCYRGFLLHIFNVKSWSRQPWQTSSGLFFVTEVNLIQAFFFLQAVCFLPE